MELTRGGRCVCIVCFPQSFGIQYGDGDEAAATAGAYLVVIASLFQDLQGVFNHLQKVASPLLCNGVNPSILCVWSPLCRDGIAVVKFTQSRKMPRHCF